MGPLLSLSQLKLSIVLFAIIFFASSSSLATPPKPKIVDAEFHTTYVPGGFDSNDHVQAVAEGTFENTCYRPASPEIQIDHQKKEIKVTPKAYYYFDGYCMMMLVRYHQVLEVGLLEAGNYKIVQNHPKTQKVLSNVSINLTTKSDPDDHLYAAISQAYFESRAGQNFVKISGEFSNSCFHIKEVRFKVSPKVIEVLPIAEFKNDGVCNEGSFPFNETVNIGPLPPARYLLHVRSLNGTAINNLVDAF